MSSFIFKKSMPEKKDLEELLQAIKKITKLSDETEYFIKLIYNELYINIKKYADANEILFFAELVNDVLTMIFVDDGAGFEYEKYTCINIKEQSKIYSENGRGITIVNQICESLTYRQNGKEVCARIKID